LAWTNTLAYFAVNDKDKKKSFVIMATRAFPIKRFPCIFPDKLVRIGA
jgi:hypothetical protein